MDHIYTVKKYMYARMHTPINQHMDFRVFPDMCQWATDDCKHFGRQDCTAKQVVLKTELEFSADSHIRSRNQCTSVLRTGAESLWQTCIWCICKRTPLIYDVFGFFKCSSSHLIIGRWQISDANLHLCHQWTNWHIDLFSYIPLGAKPIRCFALHHLVSPS